MVGVGVGALATILAAAGACFIWTLRDWALTAGRRVAGAVALATILAGAGRAVLVATLGAEARSEGRVP